MSQGSEVPEGWTVTSLNHLGKWSTGGTPSRKRKEFFGGDIPWIKSGDLTDGEVTSTEEKISEEGLNNCSAKILPPGTISIALYGATIGKLGTLAIEAATNQACANIQVNQDIVNQKFLFHFLISQRSNFIEAGQGGAQPNLTNRIVRDWLITLPPLAEQHRIVAAIEALFARLGAANARLERVPGILKQFRQSVLAAACDGRLTEDWWAEHEPSKKENYSEELISTDEQHRNNLHLTIPEDWSWTHIKSIGVVSGGLTKNSKREKFDLKLPYLRVANVYSNRLDLSEIKEIGVTKKEIDQYLLQEGDLLVVEGNGSLDQIGRVARWDGSVSPCLHQNHLIKVRLNSNTTSRYILLWLLSPYGRELITKVSSSTSGLHTLSISKVSSLPVSLPPLPEQQEIVRRVDALFALADKIEAEVAAAREKTETMRQSILAQAFSGRLVPTEAELARQEGREYEPASVLLEHIRSEKKEKKGRKGVQSTLV
jgi:type I restriction enzyme S subunit